MFGEQFHVREGECMKGKESRTDGSGVELVGEMTPSRAYAAQSLPRLQ